MIPMDPCSEATSMGMKNPAQTGQGTNALILFCEKLAFQIFG